MCRSAKSGQSRRTCASCTSYATQARNGRYRLQARAARRAVLTHLRDRGLHKTAAAVQAAPPSMLAEFMDKFGIPTSVLGDLPVPGTGATPAPADEALRIGRAELDALTNTPAPQPAPAVAADNPAQAHMSKGRQALRNTTRRAATTPSPTRPRQPQPASRPPVDLEAVRRMAAALAKVAAATPAPEAKPNCGGNLEVITKWEDQAETVFAEGGSKAACRAANAEAEMLCKGCPLMETCARNAKDNHYTGIAGGRIFIYGRQRLTPSRADRIVA